MQSPRIAQAASSPFSFHPVPRSAHGRAQGSPGQLLGRVLLCAPAVLSVLSLLADGGAAQGCWATGPVSTEPFWPFCIRSADIDGDGDQDVVTASVLDHRVAWHENVAGNGSSWTLHDVTTSALGAFEVAIADLDGDGDLDLVCASQADNRISWYENLLGDGSSWGTQDIDAAALGAVSVASADFDRDGDVDVLSGAFTASTVAWHENLNGDGSSWSKIPIDGSALEVIDVRAADVDGDGDVDAISAWGDDTITWYRNLAGDGSSWSALPVSATASFVASVEPADVDDDGDCDLVSAEGFGVCWYENLNGNGAFWVPHVIESLSTVMEVYTADVDDDGDLDVLSAASVSGQASWHENLAGDAASWRTQLIESAAQTVSVHAADVDGDGDVDAMSTALTTVCLVHWHENLGGPAASVRFRNAGGNPASLTATAPVLGQNLTATVDLTTTGHAMALVFGFDTAVDLTLNGGQRLLCLDLGGNGEMLNLVAAPGPLAAFDYLVPADSGACGTSFTIQALHFGGVLPFALSNAQDLVIGSP